jgi:hypothetical protein
MQDLTAKRTLVKSQPELWDELSEVERLAKHLGAFGEIRITKLEPEHKVAWEGEHASGTVSIEPSGWGTKVVLTAELTAEPEAPDPVPDASATEDPEPANGGPAIQIEEWEIEPEQAEEPVPEAEPTPAPLATVAPPVMAAEEPRRRRRGFWSRLFAGWLVPEERLHRASFSAPHQNVEEPIPSVEQDAHEPLLETEVEQAEEIQTVESLAAEQPPAPAADTDSEEGADQEAVAEQTATLDHERAQSVLEETLEALGSAHHRPFSRG